MTSMLVISPCRQAILQRAESASRPLVERVADPLRGVRDGLLGEGDLVVHSKKKKWWFYGDLLGFTLW